MMGPSFFFLGGPRGNYFLFFNLCPCHQPRPKMVTNSVGNQKYMQPMGRCLDFFFKFQEGGRGEEFFPFFLCSQNVPIMFLICSLSSQCVPQGCSQQHLALIPYVVPLESPPLLTYTSGPKGEALHLSKQSFILGEPRQLQLFFAMGPSK